MPDERDTGDDATRLSRFGGNDETRFTGVAAAPRTAAQAAARPDSSLAPGVLLGHTYRIEALLARGGMGEVYRARHAELDTDHAIKIILPELANDQRIVDLFRREASVLRTIRHDAVVSYDGVFRDENGRLYLVMEFADGPSLSKLMRERTFTADEIRQLGDRVADGLAVAHEKGVIHRDISPDNVILPGGQVSQAKIIDFGISKLADPETKTIIGTDFAGKYSYVSPEQLGMFGGRVDGRSDIYSLGLVLVAAAQGEALDMGQSPITVIEARRSVPDLSRVPEAVRADLAAMLQPDPADRPQSMRALVSAPGSQHARRAADTDRRRDGRGTDRRPAASSRLGLVSVAGALVIVIAVGAAAYWYLAGNGEEGTQTAQTTGTVTPPTGDATASATPSNEGITATATAAHTAAVPDQTTQDQGAQSSSGESAETKSSSIPDISTQTSGDTGAATGATADTDQATVVPENGEQPTDTQVAATFPVPDIAKLREDAQRLVQGLSCAGVQVDVSDRGDITATGYVGSEADRAKAVDQLGKLPDVGRIDNAVVVMTWPLCETLEILQAHTAYDLAAPLAPAIDPGGMAGIYHQGDHLKVTITVPPTADGYLYVDSIDAQTQAVIHLLPNYLRSENRVKAGQKLIIGTEPDEFATYIVDEKIANNLFVAIFSPKPLFEQERTIQETAREYLPELRRSLEMAEPGGIVSSSVGVQFNPP